MLVSNRDSEFPVQLALVVGIGRRYLTLGGRSLGPNGEAVTDRALLEEVAGSTVRLPARPEITKAALEELAPLPGWVQDPWLSRPAPSCSTRNVGGPR